jgi:inner membrane protein
LDNITHSLAGWALGQAGLKTQTRKGLAALILAANMPDIDVVFGWVAWEPLARHRGFTHSLVGGLLVMPPILFGVLWLLDRWQVGRGKSFKSGLPMRAGWLLALCYLGALTHPLLDLLTTYSVQLLSPFSGAWYHADALFIIDLFLWLLLGATIGWSKWRERKGRDWRRPVQAAITITLAYIGINLAISEQAKSAARASAGEGPKTSMFASPPPIYFWRRNLVWREGNCYRWSSFDALGGGLGPVSNCQPSNLRQPLVLGAIRRDPELREFLRWSVMPIAEVERGRCAVRVMIGDGRYRDPGSRSRLMSESVVPTGALGCDTVAPAQ